MPRVCGFRDGLRALEDNMLFVQQKQTLLCSLCAAVKVAVTGCCLKLLLFRVLTTYV